MLQLLPTLLALIGMSLAAPPAPPPGTLEEAEMPFQANNVFIYAERICMINNATTTWGRALEVFQGEMCEGRALKSDYANIKTCFAGGRPDNQLEKALPKIKCSIAPLLYSIYFDRVVRDCPDESEAQHITVRAMINEATFYANWPQKGPVDPRCYKNLAEELHAMYFALNRNTKPIPEAYTVASNGSMH